LEAELTFSALDIGQFDDATTFNATFRTELVAALAESAGLEVWRVSVTSVTAGSVVARVLLRFPLGAEAQRDAFLASLASDPAAALASSSVLQVGERFFVAQECSRVGQTCFVSTPHTGWIGKSMKGGALNGGRREGGECGRRSGWLKYIRLSILEVGKRATWC